MMGMALGMLLAHLTKEQPTVTWLSFLLLTVFHLYANYKAVKCLSLMTLNNERSSIVLQNFMETGQVLSPQEVSQKEHILPLWINPWSLETAKLLHRRIRLSVRVSSLKHHEMMELFGAAGSYYKKGKYMLLGRKEAVDVITHKDSTSADVLQSFIHALVFANHMDKSKTAHAESHFWMDKHYVVFIKKLRAAGWKTERLLSPSIIWRAHWSQNSTSHRIN